MNVRKSGRGRPRVNAEPVTVRIPPDRLAALNAWIARQPEPRPSRPEAIRRLVEKGLQRQNAAIEEFPAVYRAVIQAILNECAASNDEAEKDWVAVYEHMLKEHPEETLRQFQSWVEEKSYKAQKELQNLNRKRKTNPST